MFPIRDHNPSGRTPYVTWALMAANIAIFLSYAAWLDDARVMNNLYLNWALIPAEFTHGINLSSIVTSQFLHGGWMHLAGNMLFLWIYGDNMEDEMGHAPFLGFYLLGGVAAGLAQVITAPWSPVPMVGASGAIAAVMGGYLLMYPKAKVDIFLFLVIYFRIFPIPAWIVLGLWFGMQFVNGIGSDASGGGVAYWAHAGGFVAGFLLTIPVWLRKGGRGYWQRTDYHPPHPEARYPMTESRIPKIRRRR